MTWLVGRTVKRVEKMDYTWFFTFDDESTVSTESPWRLMTNERISVTSEDHGHQFGLPAPLDAVERIAHVLGDSPVEEVEVRERTSDLVLLFSNHSILEFLNLSCGYEAWRSVHGRRSVYCLGGGGLAEFGGE